MDMWTAPSWGACRRGEWAAHISTPPAAATTAPPSCGCLWQGLALEINWRQVAERRVAAMSVVEALNVGEDRRAGLGVRAEGVTLQHLALQGGKEGFGDGVVIASAMSGQASELMK